MKKDDEKEIIKLTAKKFLLTFLKLGLPFFQADRTWRKSANEIFANLECSVEEINEKIRYLRQMGYIKTFSENKEKYLEITRKGINRIKQIQLEIKPIDRPKKWDGKWRIIIFDIPNDKKLSRDHLRRLLKRLHFVMFQESTYVFPFECTEQIDQAVGENNVSQYVSIFIADAIRNEEILIKKFLDSKVLIKNDLI